MVIMVVVVTASGALTPGPLLLATIAHGAKRGAKSGLVISFAHTIIEFSLVMALALGLLTISSAPMIKLLIGLIGGTALILFGVLQIRDSLTRESSIEQDENGITSKNPLVIGLVFTAFNPYFIIWWLTIGSQLIIESLAYASWAGVTVMYLAHVWMDYAWLISTAYLSKKGTNLAGKKGYRIIMIVCSVILIFFGLHFILKPFIPEFP